IHFIWQGALLAVVAAGVLWLYRHRSANARYTISCVFLAAMLASPAISLRMLMTSALSNPSVDRVSAAIEDHGIVSTAPRTRIDNGALSIDAVWADVDAFLPMVVCGWFAGVAMLLVRMAGGLWHVRRLQVTTLAIDASRWQTAAERIAS